MDATSLLPLVSAVPGQIEGNVVRVSENGDLITDIEPDALRGAPRDDSVTIECGGHLTRGIFGTDHQEPEMTFLAVLAPDKPLVLCIVEADASRMLDIRAGERVNVHW